MSGPIKILAIAGQIVAEPYFAPAAAGRESLPAWAGQELSRLAAWELRGPQCLALVERVLAAQGDAAERELIALQHDLAALCGEKTTSAEF